MKKKVLVVILTTILTMTACGQKEVLDTNMSEAIVMEESQESTEERQEAIADAEATEESSSEAVSDAVQSSEALVPTEAPELVASSDTKEIMEATAKPTEAPAPTATPKPEKSPEPTPVPQPSPTPRPTERPNARPTEAPAPTAAPAPTTAPAPTPTQNVDTPTPVPHTSCSWDGGSVTSQPTCSSTGVKTYTCTVCGNTRTESIPTTSHNYVTETTAATCTEAGKTKTFCNICGNVQSETTNGGASGHDFQKSYWPSAPTCSSGGSYSMVCSKCGEVGEHGRDGALPHTPVERIEHQGDCANYTIVVTTCSVCGFEISRDGYLEDNHIWAEGTYEEFNLETLQWETKTRIYCTVCGKYQ